ncbi:odorant receptor 67c-like [Leptopilina boulardi]|uniref:odorant receptor 67c-like n=1 Tax=Leptopilina boulardi TaxID=63433 RepID=UPI0021F50D9B|nr:odorant receptor 67c-like [Leptopilina boulardi]
MFPIGELSFTLMEYLGIWRPISFTSKWSIFIYNVYSIFIIIIMYFHTSTFFVNMCLNFNNTDLLIDNIIYFTGLTTLCFKMTYIKIYRNDFIAFKNMFLDTKCITQNRHELSIQFKFFKNDRFNSRFFAISCFAPLLPFIIVPLTNELLIYKTWIPYDINSKFRFWITGFFQSLAASLTSAIYSAVEIIAAIMMHQICLQLEICMYRLMNLSKLLKQNDNKKIDTYRQEAELLENCVMHHVHIFRLNKKLNDLFGSMVFMQFFASTISLCTVVYQLSKLSIMSLKFLTMFIMLSAFLVQIFLYCFFGELMIEKSLAICDVIYHIKWTTLTEKTKRNLIMIMIRSRRPIELNGASMITMSVNTFVKILKASFSIFNLLQSTT